MAEAQRQQLPLPWAQGGIVGVAPGDVTLPIKPSAPVPEALLAPPPQTDKFPIVIGNPLNLAYITATYRLASEGWRWQAVDVWNELLEHDPHARGVSRQRFLPVVAARADIIPAELPETATAKEKKLAKDIAAEVKRQWNRIPARMQALGKLAWGIGYGMSCAETMWDRDLDSPAPKGWEITGLRFVHSRRLNCTDPNSLDVYIYDQGPSTANSQTNYSAGQGLRIAAFPGKFVVHCPALNGDYALRDGEFRYIGVYLALKRMIVRCSAQDYERVIRPWVLGYFNREADKNKNPVATTPDIQQLLATVKSLGLGSLNGAVLPDACRVELVKQAASAGNPREFADWLDHQITESLLGQTYTTGPQKSGTHEAAGVAADGTRRISEYDAQCLADTLERDLIYFIVALNWDAKIAKRYCPTLKFAVSETPDPMMVAQAAKILTAIDVPLDARKVGAMAQMPVIDPGDVDTMETGRTRVITGGKDTPVEPEASNDPNSPNYEPPPVAAPPAPAAAATKPAPKRAAGTRKAAPTKKSGKGSPTEGGAAPREQT